MSEEAGKSENRMGKEEAIAQLKDLILDRKAFIDKSEANSVFQDDIDALTYAVNYLQKDPKPTPETLAAIKTLDAVIPPPGNRMVDLEHLHIAQAWKTIREQLLQPREDTE